MRRSIVPAILGLILCGAVPAAEADNPALKPAPAKLNPKLVELADNTWVYMDPKPYKAMRLTARDENSPVKESTGKEPVFREYTFPVYGNGKIFYFGGGHSGYHGNDMEIYDPVENAWRQCYAPHCPPKDDSTYSSGGSERCYVDPETGAGQPYVLHGYARTSYHAGLKRYVCTATFPTKVEQDPTIRKWKLVTKAFCLVGFDDQANRWELLAANSKVQGHSGLSQYDADLGSILGFAGSAVSVFKDGDWKPLANAGVPMSYTGGAASIYVPDQKSHLVAVMGHGGAKDEGRLTSFSTAEKKGREIASAPEDLKKRFAPGTGGFNFVMAYDTANRKVVAMSADGARKPEVWTYDPPADKWEKLPPGANAPVMEDGFSPACRAPLLYDPVHNVFLLVVRGKDWQVATWAYRYKKETTR
jgi:hypothetical protein